MLKKLNIKIFIILIGLGFPIKGFALLNPSLLDTSLLNNLETPVQEWPLSRLQQAIKVLVPKEAQVQYGGSIGFLSVGFGYPLWEEKGNLSLHAGFVPETKGGAFTVLAVKFAYQPYLIKLGNHLEWKPFNPVFFPSYTLGSHYSYRFSTNQYRANYYFWSTALRLHIGANSEFKIKFKGRHSIHNNHSAISLFTEANTNDLYLISWVKNREVAPITNLFKLGFGIKAHF